MLFLLVEELLNNLCCVGVTFLAALLVPTVCEHETPLLLRDNCPSKGPSLSLAMLWRLPEAPKAGVERMLADHWPAGYCTTYKSLEG